MLGEAMSGTGWLLQRPWIALVLALILESLVLVVGRGDFVASDPLWYASIAHQIAVDPSAAFASGETHPFVMRIGLTVPIALLYRAFGVSTLVSNLPCLLAALGVLLVAYAAAPTPRAKLLAVLFGVCCAPLIRHASVLNVDLPCAALMACAILWLSWRDRPRGAWWLAGAAVAWIAAFLVKETAIWLGVVWIYAIVVDVRALGPGRAARRFAPAVAVGAALCAGYAALCAQLWGSPWARFHGIEDLTYGHAWSLHGRGAAAWLARLTWQPAVLFATMFQATLVPVVLAPWLVRDRARIWWFATAAFVLLYWLGSTSLSSYSPLPISQRMVLPVLPGLVVLAALASDRALDRLRGSRWRAPVAVAVAIAVAVPAVHVMSARLVRPRPETASFAVLRDEAADPGRRIVLVCGEPRCVDISGFYFDFAPPPNLTVVFANDFARAPRPEGATVRALVNLTRSPGARRTDPQLDRTPSIEALALRPLVWDRSVRLYDAGDGARLWEALRAVD
jgi:hypothetical protein